MQLVLEGVVLMVLLWVETELGQLVLSVLWIESVSVYDAVWRIGIEIGSLRRGVGLFWTIRRLRGRLRGSSGRGVWIFLRRGLFC